MEAKKLIMPLVGLVGLGAIVFVAFWYQPKEVAAPSDQHDQEQPLITSEKRISEKSGIFNIDIVYPAIDMIGFAAFNKEVEAFVREQLADFKANATANDNAVKEMDPESYKQYPRVYDFVGSYQASQIDEKIASVVLNIYIDTGGAHGNTIFRSFNYDLVKQKNIALSDVFSDQPDYLEKISEYCMHDLTNQINERLGEGAAASSWIQDGAGPKIDNFSTFTLQPGSITFYFPPYQVSSYAAGPFSVTMPR